MMSPTPLCYIAPVQKGPERPLSRCNSTTGL
jgi:hypothetical protein